MNAAVDTLPHNCNLFLRRKKLSKSCPLCQQGQTLIHVLNNCSTALKLRHYNKHLGLGSDQLIDQDEATSMTADLPDQFEFPQHIVSTDLRADIVVWNDQLRQLQLVELTVCFGTATMMLLGENRKDMMTF